MGGNGRYMAMAGRTGLCALILMATASYSGSAQVPAAPRREVHGEYVKYASGTDTVTAYIAYAEDTTPVPAVLVIHEDLGLSPFVRQTTERLAKAGYTALAPDLLSRRGGTPASEDSARRLIASLNPDTITQDLDAGVAFLRTLKSVRGYRIGVMGFGWGGGESFRYATNNPSLGAFVVCYGPAPRLADIKRINAPGLGVYADRDVRNNQELFHLLEATSRASVSYRFKVYGNTKHGFLRTDEMPKVSSKAWADVIEFFRVHLFVKKQ